MSNAYADSEKISYEGVGASIKSILTRVDETSELQNEINKVNELANELVRVWTSDASQKAKASIDEVGTELVKVRVELKNLLAELSKYNEAANAINTGTI